ncbi:CHAT domain-containing tetratricopeptide repeat protein [Limibacter armeniacum]|uniref:CHAT domain-containing tetratricopeptide repeat protein n=1 Tax=Limibacter armeniacum TaxID=466084 RepID=UPI002FE50309
MNHCLFTVILAFLLLCNWNGNLKAQSRIDKDLRIGEIYYHDGEYIKALERGTLAVQAAEGQHQFFQHAKALTHLARYQATLGHFEECQQSLNQALEILQEQDASILTQAKAWLEAGRIYLAYFDINTAEQYFYHAGRMMDEYKASEGSDNQKWDSSLDEDLTEARMEIAFSRGEYQSAAQWIERLQSIRKDRIVSEDIIFDEGTQKFQQVKLKRTDRKRRQQAYAKALTMKGRLQRLKGDYTTASKELADAEAWILDVLHKNDPAYVLNRHEQTLTKLDRGVELKEGRKMIEKNIFAAERLFGPVHQEFMKIQADMILYYIRYGYGQKSEFPRWEFLRNTERYFGSDNIWHSKGVRLDAVYDYQRQNYERAEKDLLDVYFDTVSVPKNNEEHLAIVKQLYTVNLAEKDFTMANIYLNRWVAATASVYGEESLPYYKAKVEEAAYLVRFTNNFETADSLYNIYLKGKIKQQLHPSHYEYRKMLSELIAFYEIKGQFDSVAVLADEMLESCKINYGESHFGYSEGLAEMARSEMQQGHYKEAYAYVNQLEELLKTTENPKGAYDNAHIKALQTAAKYYILIGLYNDARDKIYSAQRISYRLPLTVEDASSADDLVQIFLETERFRETEEMTRKSVETRTERFGENNRYLITPLNQQARLHYLKGEYMEADSTASKAYEIAYAVFGDNSLQTAESLEIKADVRSAMGDYEGSKKLLMQLLDFLTKVYGENHLEVANVYTRLAMVGIYSGHDASEAESLLSKSVDIIKGELGTDNPAYNTALKNLAMARVEQGQYDEARGMLNTVAQNWVKRLGSELNTNSGEIHLLLGDLEMRTGNFKVAADHYGKARTTYKKVFDKFHPLYVKASARQGRAFYSQKRYWKSRLRTEEALDNYYNYIGKFFPALSTNEKTRYWHLIRGDFEFYTNLAFKTGRKKLERQVFANILSTKSLLLNSSIKIRNRIMSSNDSLLKADYEHWLLQKEVLTKVLAMPEQYRNDQGLDLKDLEASIVELEKSLSQRSKLFEQGMNEQQKDWVSVKEALKEGEAAVEIVRYKHFDKVFTDSVVYAAMIITPKTKKAPKVVLLENGNELETDGLGYYRTCIEFGIPDQHSYKRFWKPIEDELKGYSHIYLSADGVYSQINIESIPRNWETHDYVLDNKNITLLGSTLDLLDMNQRKRGFNKKEEVALFGNPVYYSDLKEDEYNQYTARVITQLPGSVKEVEKIEELISTKKNVSFAPHTYLYQNATEGVVKELSSPAVFHIATHGFFLEDEEQEDGGLMSEQKATNPLLRSGLLLTNGGELLESENVYQFNKAEGVLTAYEAMNLNFDETELVVLSACETGRGDNKVGEGVYGLQRAFLVAGAKAIIMSLFEVSDEATQQLMLYFYENWLDRKMDKRAAFIEAKKQLRKDFPDPKFWGAFVMVGV